VSDTDLVALVCCDLGSIVRGRSVRVAELEQLLGSGVGWVPANQSLTPLGGLAEPNPFGSKGDLRLLPDVGTRVRVPPQHHADALEFVLCDIVHTDGRPWECCPRHVLREALEALRGELGLRLVASFEHEFQLLGEPREALPFSLDAQRLAAGFAREVMQALAQAGAEPERFFPEFAAHQFEVPVRPAEGTRGADRSVVLKEVVRECARRRGLRASFTPLLDPAGPGNGVHIHFNLLDSEGLPKLYDADQPARLSELGASFAAGILRHARALSALTAASPVSALRLAPHHWSAGAVCLAERDREALLRIPAVVELGGAAPDAQLHLEYRGADASANPYLALAALVRAGLVGVREGLSAAPVPEGEPAAGQAATGPAPGVLPDSLEQAMQELAQDEVARAWMTPLLYDAYVALKRSELQQVAGLDMSEVCRLYAAAY
jgi:glutamine synthetase